MPQSDYLQNEFILEMFRLCLHDREVLEIVTTYVKPNYLQQQNEKDLFQALRYQQEIGKRPTFGTLKLELRANNDALELLDEVQETELSSPESIIKSLEEFLFQCKFVDGFDEIADTYSKPSRGGKKKAFDLFRQLHEELNNLSLTNDSFNPVFSGFEKRVVKRRLEGAQLNIKRPTGIDELDYLMNGGPETKEYILFLAGSKQGKSFLGVHLGVNYARRGIGVLHIQLEGTERQLMNRYDAAWTGSLYNDIKTSDLEENKLAAFKKIAANRGKGEIYVWAPERFESVNMVQIRSRVIKMKRLHPEIGVTIIDYLELANPDNDHYGPKDERYRQQKTSKLMKQLAMDTDTLVISFTQATDVDQELINEKSFVLTRNNLSEDRGKIRPVDGLVTINRTREEEEENVCRLWMEGMREMRGGRLITIKQNLDRSRFYDKKATLNSGYFEM